MFGIKKGLAFLSPAESGAAGAGAVGAMKKEGGDADPIVFSDTKPRSVVPSAEELRGGQVIQWPVKKDPALDEHLEALRVVHHSDLVEGADPTPEEKAHAEEVLASEAKKAVAEAQAAPEGEDAEINVRIGQAWRCADAAFRVDDIADDEQSIRIIFTEGRLAGEHRTFSVEDFGDFIGDKEFSIVPEEASEENLRQAMAVMEHSEQERSNPLVRPVMKLLGEARVMAEERQDKTMLAYLAENDDLIGSLAGKRRLENAELGLLKDVREKLEGYPGSLAALETEKPAPAETNGKAEQEKQEDPIGEFRDRVGRYAEDIDSQIARASSFSALKGIGAVEEQPIKGSVITLRKFASAEDGELLASIASVKSPSRRDAMKKVLHDADRALRKAWHRKASELGADAKKEKKGERKKRVPKESAPERVATSKRERPKKENSTEKQQRSYEVLETAAEEDGAYYTIFGALGTGLRKMREAVPGIIDRKDAYAERIAGALAMTLEDPVEAAGDRLGWTNDEKKVFLEMIVKKGIGKFLK